MPYKQAKRRGSPKSQNSEEEDDYVESEKDGISGVEFISSGPKMHCRLCNKRTATRSKTHADGIVGETKSCNSSVSPGGSVDVDIDIVVKYR